MLSVFCALLSLASALEPCPVGKARKLGTTGPCDITTCAAFDGTCEAGQIRAPSDKECLNGVCDAATCCDPKPCGAAETAGLCVGQWIPKVFNTSNSYQFGEMSSRTCQAGWERLDSLQACKAAATALKVPFVKSLNSPRYPHGCFQCSSAAECNALIHGLGAAALGGLFWNENPQSKSKGVADIRHIGTKVLCQKSPPGCKASGCDAETCCTPLRCDTNFASTCFAGEEPKPGNTICNLHGKSRATSCTRADCCQPKTCASTDLKGICNNGWMVNPAAHNTQCPSGGCDKATCCKEELCGTDFPDKCGAGEDLLAQVKCPAGGCTRDICCQRKTCSSFSCTQKCSEDWMTKQGNIFCDASGCDENTCCEIKTCNLDWKGKCGAGQLRADPHTICPGGKCSADVCCIGRLCADSFSCSAHGLPLGLKARPVGTMCAAGGCDANTCCATATCGTDFPQGGCGPWATQKPDETVCNGGKCDDQSCCVKKDCVITQATCNTGKIAGIKSFSVYNTQYPNANVDANQAEGACASLDRSECFATLDEDCDGKSLKRCLPNHANDPSSLVLRPSSNSCVCYRKEQPTCGYNMPDSQFCGVGEKVQFYKPCGGSTGKLCDTKTCCAPLTCQTSAFQCPVGDFLRNGDAVCPKEGCDAATCCTVLTCGTDFKQACPAGTAGVNGSTKCTAGVCTVDTCCQVIAQTTPPPKQDVCSTDYRGSCSHNEEFLPNNICQGASFILAPKDTDQCPPGYNRVTTLSQCAAGTEALKDKLQLNGEDGTAMPTDEASITNEIQKLTIASGSGLGEHKPNGCYYESQNMDVKGDQMTINTVWLNLDQTVASRLLSCVDGRRLDGSPCTTAPPPTPPSPCTTAAPPPPPAARALICSSNAACSHENCCKAVGQTVTCDSFNGCKDALGLVARSGHIMCANGGCDTAQCCRSKTCGDFFASNAGAGACGEHQNRNDHDISCNGGPCSQALCCRNQPTTTTQPNPCTTAYIVHTAPPLPAVETVAPTPAPAPAPSPCTTVAPPAAGSTPAPAPATGQCGNKFALGELDTTTCPTGYTTINTVAKCVQGAQYLKIQPSDTNGDGQTTNIEDTDAMTAFVSQREIQASDPLGIHKPHGCFQDVSIRLVKGEQARITTVWLNHRTDQTGAHDNSSPICQEDCSSDTMLQKYNAQSAADTRHAMHEKIQDSNVPTFAITALSFVAFLVMFSLVQRRSGRSARATDILYERTEETELVLGTEASGLE